MPQSNMQNIPAVSISSQSVQPAPEIIIDQLGTELTPPEEKKSKWWIWLLIILVLGGAAVYYFFFR